MPATVAVISSPLPNGDEGSRSVFMGAPRLPNYSRGVIWDLLSLHILQRNPSAAELGDSLNARGAAGLGEGQQLVVKLKSRGAGLVVALVPAIGFLQAHLEQIGRAHV